MAFLLDTNVLSELRKAHRADKNVKSWQAKYPIDEQWISVISLMEVRIGVIQAQKRDIEFAAVLDTWYYNQLVPGYQNRILTVDLDTVEKRAVYAKLRTLNYSDALIAATAAINRMDLVTRNTKDFEDLGINLINPWETPRN